MKKPFSRGLRTLAPTLAVTVLLTVLAAPDLEAQNQAAADPLTPDGNASAPGKLITSFAELEELMTQDGVEFESVPEATTIQIKTGISEQAGPLLVRWDERQGVVHFIQAVPVRVPDDRLREIESTIVRVNHGMLMPGFGMNHTNRLIYCRVSIPIQLRGGILDREIRSYFNFVLKHATDLAPLFVAVAHQEVPADEALEFHQQQRRKKNTAIAGTYKIELGDGTWQLTLFANSRAEVRQNGKLMVESTYSLNNNVMTLADQGGELACQGGQRAGIYAFKLENDQLTLKALDDSCADRVKLLTNQPWPRTGDAAAKDADTHSDSNSDSDES